ncbi:hypothetical protein KC726_02820 [Candidatus Woesebacteria bacterium]|nr:hypothetical protein [Candidatus Woesebacteria bacterium]
MDNRLLIGFFVLLGAAIGIVFFFLSDSSVNISSIVPRTYTPNQQKEVKLLRSDNISFQNATPFKLTLNTADLSAFLVSSTTINLAKGTTYKKLNIIATNNVAEVNNLVSDGKGGISSGYKRIQDQDSLTITIYAQDNSEDLEAYARVLNFSLFSALAEDIIVHDSLDALARDKTRLYQEYREKVNFITVDSKS